MDRFCRAHTGLTLPPGTPDLSDRARADRVYGPGVTLPPGTYLFEAGPAYSSPDVVRVSRNRRTVFIGMTIPAVRAQGAEPGLVTFEEAARGEAARILAWYPSGSNQGHQFLYR